VGNAGAIYFMSRYISHAEGEVTDGGLDAVDEWCDEDYDGDIGSRFEGVCSGADK